MWKTYGFPVHKCYTNGGLIPHRTVSLQKIRRVFVIPLNEIPLNVGNQNWFCVARPEKPLGTPPGFHHWLQLSSKPYDWCHCCCFFGCILIWASSWFKLFVHFGPSNDALSIGRSCWFWPRDGARCRLESLLMVMTHRCLNPIVLGRVGWWVKAWCFSGDLVPPHWVELRRIVVHCWFPKQLYVSYEGVSFLPAISWPRTAWGVAKAGIFLNHLSNWGPRFNQMSPGSRTVGSRIQRLHWGGLWCFPSGKVEGDETEAWNEPQDPIRSAT